MKIFIQSFFIICILLSFSNCSSEKSITPPTPPKVITAEELLGTWEIYFSRKDLTFGGVLYEGFRDPEMDGYRTKFYKENNVYKFVDYNTIGEVIDAGKYDVADGNIIFDVEKIEDRDTAYTTKQKLMDLKLEQGLLFVNYSFSLKIDGDDFQISDIRRLRNVQTAPQAHPNVNKVMVNFDDYIGTWQIYNIEVLINGTWSVKASEKELDKPNITTFRFYYDDKGRKMGQRSTYYPVEDSTSTLPPMPVTIIDDVIHLLFKIQLENGRIENDGIFLWITERKAYTDPDTNKKTEMILDNDEFRDKDSPMDLYKRRRYLKKVE